MENQNDENLEVVNESCWFCKQREAQGEALNVPLHYTLSEKHSHDKVEYEYSKAKVEVPRCGNCQRTHHNIWLILIVLGIIMIFSAILAIHLYFMDWSLTIIVGLAISAFFVLFRFIYLVPIVYLANLLGLNTEWRSRNYPIITAYQNEGWRIGDDPIWKYTYCHRG